MDNDFIPDDQFQPDAPPSVSPAAPNSQQDASSDFIPDSEFQSDEDKYGGIGSQLGAVAHGALKGAVGPLAPVIEGGLGFNEEDVRGAEAAHPVLSGIGEAGGLAGSMLTGVGEGALVSKLGSAVEGKIAPVVGEGLVGKVATEAGKAAVENMAIAASDEFTKSAMNDPDQTAQSAVIDVGLAGLLGGGIGAGLGAISPLWKAASGSKVSQAISDFSDRLKNKVETPDLADHLKESLQNAHDSIDAGSKMLYEEGGLKENEIRNNLPKNPDLAFSQGDELSTKGRKLAATLERDKAPGAIVNKVTDATDRFETSILQASESKDPYGMYKAINTYKQELGALSKFESQTQDFAAKDALGKVRNTWGEVQKNLENEDVWGKAGKVQKDINEAYSDLQGKKGPLAQFRSKFMTNINGEFKMDPGKIDTYLKQIGNPRAEVKQEMLKNFTEGHDNFHKVIQGIYDKAGAENPLVPVSLQAAKATTEEVSFGAKIADWIYNKGATQLGGNVLGGLAGGVLGHAVGHPDMGVLIGEHTLSPLFAHVLPAMAKPLATMATSAEGAKAGLEYLVNAYKGSNTIAKAGKSIFTAGREVLPQSLIPDEKDRAKLDSRIKGAQTDPNILLKAGGKTSVYLPNHGQAIGQTASQAVNYLNSLRPNPDKAAPLDSKPVLNPVAKAAYNRALDIAQQPLMVMKHIKDGTLQPSDVVALKTMYPALYSKFTSEITSHMTDHIAKGNTIPYTTRLSIATFMGQPLDSTMLPSNIIAAQSIGTPQQQQPTPQGGKLNQGAAKGLNKVAESYQTSTQKREQDRQVKS